MVQTYQSKIWKAESGRTSEDKSLQVPRTPAVLIRECQGLVSATCRKEVWRKSLKSWPEQHCNQALYHRLRGKNTNSAICHTIPWKMWIFVPTMRTTPAFALLHLYQWAGSHCPASTWPREIMYNVLPLDWGRGHVPSKPVGREYKIIHYAYVDIYISK